MIRHQSEGQNVTCEPTSSGSRNIEGKISWQIQPGNTTHRAMLSVDPNKDWDLQPVCMATFRGIGKCQKAFQFTLYSTCFLASFFVSSCTADGFFPCGHTEFSSTEAPDDVSVRRVDNLSAVVEERPFQLRCEITSVAPARSLTIRWYQGNKTVQLTAGKGGLPCWDHNM